MSKKYNISIHPDRPYKMMITFVDENKQTGTIVGGGHHHILDIDSKPLHFPTIFGHMEAVRYVLRLNNLQEQSNAS